MTLILNNEELTLIDKLVTWARKTVCTMPAHTFNCVGCNGSCEAECVDTCWNQCPGSCYGTCYPSCEAQCPGTCTGTCKDTCEHGMYD